MNQVKIAWYGKHLGEEPPLLPAGGIFFSGCDLRCVFCQNYQISQQGLGKFYSVEDLAQIMIKLQNVGANNIDLVSPNIWQKQIAEAIILAKAKGLKIPIVWNSNGYENLETTKDIAGLVDIYLPDFKYSNDELAYKYSGIKNYSARATDNIREMLGQVGHLKIVEDKATRGVIVRHMVLPNNLENSFGVLKLLSQIDTDIHVSLMNQYFPVHKANLFPELAQTVTQEDFDKVYGHLLDLGFSNGWIQGEKSPETFVPDFTKINPFE